MYQIKTNGKVFTTVQTKAQVKTITATLRSMKIKYSTKLLTSLLLLLISLSTFAGTPPPQPRAQGKEGQKHLFQRKAFLQ